MNELPAEESAARVLATLDLAKDAAWQAEHAEEWRMLVRLKAEDMQQRDFSRLHLQQRVRGLHDTVGRFYWTGGLMVRSYTQSGPFSST